MSTPETWLTAAQAAEHLGRNVHEVRRRAHDQRGGRPMPANGIPGYKVGGQWRFSRDQLDRWVKGEDVVRVTPGPASILSPRSRARQRAS